MSNPQSKADVDPNFEKRCREIQRAAAQEAEARGQGGSALWFRPEGWSGDLFDLQAMHTPFDRKKANEDYLQAVKDPESPGTVGDVVATTTMIDYLSQMELGFRLRHTLRRPRAMALALGRKKGHGDEQGPVTQCTLEYVRSVLKQAKQQG